MYDDLTSTVDMLLYLVWIVLHTLIIQIMHKTRFSYVLPTNYPTYPSKCDAGFRIGHIGQKHTEPDFDSPLESLEEVDKITLAYDVEDLLRLKVRLVHQSMLMVYLLSVPVTHLTIQGNSIYTVLILVVRCILFNVIRMGP